VSAPAYPAVMIEIREALPIDTEGIVRLTADGWRAAYPGIVPARNLRTLPITGWRHDIRAGLRAPEADSFTRIAELDGQMAGYCYVAAPGRGEPEGSPVAEVVAIYVAPAMWRRGVGQQLMARAASEAKRLAYEELVVWTFEKNMRALSFYAAEGFELDGERRPHEATGVTTARLRRKLT
jgi:GNAT superfamily N-acetyltransferase